jgi:hypothetical protein
VELEKEVAESTPPYRTIDSGVFNNHLVKLALDKRDQEGDGKQKASEGYDFGPGLGHMPKVGFGLIERPGLVKGSGPKPVQQGTYEGIKAFVAEAYSRVEQG